MRNFSIAVGLAMAIFAAPQATLSANAYERLSIAQAQAPLELDAEAEARIKAALAALVPEYNQRLARDGETSANDWIRQKAFELGQREADIMNERLGL